MRHSCWCKRSMQNCAHVVAEIYSGVVDARRTFKISQNINNVYILYAVKITTLKNSTIWIFSYSIKRIMTTNISRDNSTKSVDEPKYCGIRLMKTPSKFDSKRTGRAICDLSLVEIGKKMDSRIRKLRSRCQTSHTISIFALCVPRHSRAAESIREHWIKLLPLRSACIRKATQPSWRENTWIRNKQLCPHRLTHKIDEWQVVM